MSGTNRKLFAHLEDLRKDAEMTIKDLCEGICDRRQYSRYISGDSEITLRNITSFYHRLGFSDAEFYHSFHHSEFSLYPKLNTLYYALMDRDTDKASTLLSKLNRKMLTTDSTKKYYDLLVIYYEYLSKKVAVSHTLEQLKDLIDYEHCLHKKYFHFVDVVSLRLIMIIEMRNNERRTLDFLYNVLLEDNIIYVTSETRNVLPSIYASVTRQYGMMGDNDEVLKIVNKGIDYSIDIRNMHLLQNMYYYRSLALFKLGHKEEALIAARKALEVCDIIGDDEDTLHLKTIMDKDFNMDVNDLFKNFKI